ncbi:hypothetical protein IAR50_000628 [Cryptococcus sp. DSM 104548]
MAPYQQYQSQGQQGHGLPARPAFAPSNAGPSNQPAYPPAQSYTVYPQQGFYPAQSAYGGYQANMSGGYPAGGFYPMYNQAASVMGNFQQRPMQPAANAEGYSYSSAYLSSQPSSSGDRSTGGDPPAKKQRTNHPPASAGPSTKAWRNCSQAGCKFVGPGDQVEIHEEDRHLIYVPGKKVVRSEEEERFARQKGPLPPIQGTSITLNTPEDIEKWIAERKARWPSAKRVQEKEEERKSAIERGEMPENGRGKGRKLAPAAMAEEWGREARPMEDRRERDGTRGRGRGRGGARGRGGRTGGDEGRAEVKVGRDPGQQNESVATTSDAVGAASLPALGGYDSARDGSSSDSSSSSESSSESDSSDSESEYEDDDTKPSTAKAPAPTAPSKPICKFFAKAGRCKFNDKCRFAHVAPEGAAAPRVGATTQKPELEKKEPKQPMQKRANPFERPSILGALLANPIHNTVSQLSQTIRFLVANDMLRNVELRPGQAEDEEREKIKVVVVGDGETPNTDEKAERNVVEIAEIAEVKDEENARSAEKVDEKIDDHDVEEESGEDPSSMT